MFHYKIPCQFCEEIVERSTRRADATCFDCKIKRQKFRELLRIKDRKPSSLSLPQLQKTSKKGIVCPFCGSNVAGVSSSSTEKPDH